MEVFRYKKKEDERIDREFENASRYGKVALGKDLVFWKKGLRWMYADMNKIERAFRRIEAVDTKMCCGHVNFDIQKLVLIPRDGGELELLIGEGIPREAEALYEELRGQGRDILFGKA